MIENYKTDLPVGTLCNFQYGEERLVYMGYNFSGNGYWHQFAKLEEWHTVWSEVLPKELNLLEISEPSTDKYQYWGKDALSKVVFDALSKELESSPTLPTGHLMNYVSVMGDDPIFGEGKEYVHSEAPTYDVREDGSIPQLPSKIKVQYNDNVGYTTIESVGNGDKSFDYVCSTYSYSGEDDYIKEEGIQRVEGVNEVMYLSCITLGNNCINSSVFVTFTKPLSVVEAYTEEDISKIETKREKLLQFDWIAEALK